jgi:hypothetical protein
LSCRPTNILFSNLKTFPTTINFFHVSLSNLRLTLKKSVFWCKKESKFCFKTIAFSGQTFFFTEVCTNRCRARDWTRNGPFRYFYFFLLFLLFFPHAPAFAHMSNEWRMLPNFIVYSVGG